MSGALAIYYLTLFIAVLFQGMARMEVLDIEGTPVLLRKSFWRYYLISWGIISLALLWLFLDAMFAGG